MPKKQITPLNEEFDFKLFVTIAQRNVEWFLMFMTLSVIIWYVIVRYTAPMFESSALMKLNTDNNVTKALNITRDVYQEQNNELAGNLELIRSSIIVSKAIATLPLRVTYISKGTLLENEMYKSSPFEVNFLIKDSLWLDRPFYLQFINEKSFVLSYIPVGEKDQIEEENENGKWIHLKGISLQINVINYQSILKHQSQLKKNTFKFIINSDKALIKDFSSKLSVIMANPDAKTINIKVKEKNATKASDMSNAISQEFLKFDVLRSREATDRILDFIDTTLYRVNNDLSESEINLERFKSHNRIITPELLATDLSSKMSQIELRLTDYTLNLLAISELKKAIESEKKVDEKMLSLAGIYKTDEIKEALNSLNVLLDKREEALIQVTDKAEYVKMLNGRIQRLKEYFLQSVTYEEEGIKTKKAELESQYRKLNSNYLGIPEQQTEFERLQRIFNVNEKFYSLLLEKKAEFSITRAGFVSKNIILEAARPASAPYYPNKSLILSSCIMVGFVVSFLLIFIKYLFYNQIGSLEEIAQYTDAPLLGIVPRYKREIPISQLLVDKSPKSVIAEAFRSIRTNLQFINNDEKPQLMALTSTISGEGKTFNAINLAGVISFSGKKVIILDLDMRKPKIHLGFNVENNRGMSTILIGKDTIENCINHSALENLDFITAGPIPPNPSELIISPKMDELLEYLKLRYDVIIADTPPVGVVSDGIPMIQKADFPIYILRANYSRKMFIHNINKIISENKVPRLSVVLNSVD
ncbi:MAG TPA: polysaccharide biosynthesis tyrosine autokinase, partial [Bacteroidia bacterium]|nr:polysaccharide biosynthesis tyrosine autokinase [Bacteroidia bacterium]